MRSGWILAWLIALLGVAEARADETATEADLALVGWWPDLATGPDGAVHLVYARCRPCAVHYRVWRDGWSAEEAVTGSGNISTDDVNSARVAVDDAGQVHVVWAEDIRTDNAPWYARRSDGGWEAAVRVSNDANEDIEGLDIETHGDTVYIAANVLDPDVTPPTGPGSETRLYSRAASGAGSFSRERLGDQGKDVRLFRGAGGDRLYVLYWWIRWRFDRFLGFRLHRHEGDWSGELTVPTEGLPEDSPGEGSLVADGSGAVTIAFTQWTGSTPTRIYVREPDGTFVAISADAVDADSPPALTLDSQGSRYVVWADAEARLRYSNSQFWRAAWVPEGVFPTLTEVEQVTIATAGDANHLVWRDPETRHLHHNRRLIRRDDAALVTHTIPAVLVAEESRDVVVRLRNTGNLPWPAGGAWQLAAVDDADPLASGLRVAPNMEVPPGGEHDFGLRLQAPAAPGAYTTDWRMVRQDAYGFGETVTRGVDVVAAGEDVGMPPGDAGVGDVGTGDSGPRDAESVDTGRGDLGPGDAADGGEAGDAAVGEVAPDHSDGDPDAVDQNGASAGTPSTVAGCGCRAASGVGGRFLDTYPALPILLGVGIWARRRRAAA